MKKKIVAFIIIGLVYLFPFRWAFLQYPDNVKVNNTLIDAGRGEYILYMLMVIFGVLIFMLLTVSDKHATVKK